MHKIRTIIIVMLALFVSAIIHADTPTVTQEQLAQINGLKLQLFKDLDTGDITSGNFDPNTEMAIARVQTEIANYYFTLNDRKNAIISAILARKILQRLYGTANDPRLIPIYSLLVQLYSSSIDIDTPNQDVSDAAKAKKYRELIDHIHAL